MVAFLSPAAFDMSHQPRSWFAKSTGGNSRQGGPMGLTRRQAMLGVGGLAVLASRPAQAQAAYPSRNIKMIVPYPPGGTTDLLGRLIADQIKSGLNAVVIVENKPGAGTTLGAGAGRTLRSGRLHALDGDLDHACDQQDALQEAALRPGEGFRADRAGRRRAVRADHQPKATGRRPRRVHRLRQGQSGTGLRLGRQRQSAASRRGDAEIRGQYRHPPCALPRQHPGDARRDRGPYSLHGRGPAAGAAADQGGQGQGARRDHAEARHGRAGHPDHRRGRACPATSSWPGRAWWRRPARRARSWTCLPRRSQSCCPIPPQASASPRLRSSRLPGSTPDGFAAYIRTEVDRWADIVRKSGAEAE